MYGALRKIRKSHEIKLDLLPMLLYNSDSCTRNGKRMDYEREKGINKAGKELDFV